MATKPVSTKWDEDLLTQIDVDAKEKGINRTKWLQFAAQGALNVEEGNSVPAAAPGALKEAQVEVELLRAEVSALKKDKAAVAGELEALKKSSRAQAASAGSTPVTRLAPTSGWKPKQHHATCTCMMCQPIKAK